MLHSGSGGQGCPLATGPSGLESEPKAPGKAWREDVRHPQGLSTGSSDIAASTTHRHRWDYPPAPQISQPATHKSSPPNAENKKGLMINMNPSIQSW